MSKRIINMIPSHERYFEVFFGGGSVFFRKKKAKLNIINDIDNDLVNLYLCVLNEFDKFKETAWWYAKSRELHNMFREEIKDTEFKIPDPVRAAKYYYTIKNAFNRIATSSFSTHSDWGLKLFEQLELSRKKLDGVTIENLHFKDLIERYNPRKGDFFYLDPPYVVTEKRKDYYRNVLNRDEHIQLKESVDYINSRGGNIMISYDNHEVVQELYSDQYYMNTINTKYTGTMCDKDGKFHRDMIKTELLITNYKITEQKELF